MTAEKRERGRRKKGREEKAAGKERNREEDSDFALRFSKEQEKGKKNLQARVQN